MIKAANDGDHEAQAELGFRYSQGVRGAPHHAGWALRYTGMAADANNARAEKNLLIMYKDEIIECAERSWHAPLRKKFDAAFERTTFVVVSLSMTECTSKSVV